MGINRDRVVLDRTYEKLSQICDDLVAYVASEQARQEKEAKEDKEKERKRRLAKISLRSTLPFVGDWKEPLDKQFVAHEAGVYLDCWDNWVGDWLPPKNVSIDMVKASLGLWRDQPELTVAGMAKAERGLWMSMRTRYKDARNGN